MLDAMIHWWSDGWGIGMISNTCVISRTGISSEGTGNTTVRDSGSV